MMHDQRLRPRGKGKKNWQNWNRNGKKRIGKIGIGIGKKELAKDLTLHPEMM